MPNRCLHRFILMTMVCLIVPQPELEHPSPVNDGYAHERPTNLQNMAIFQKGARILVFSQFLDDISGQFCGSQMFADLRH